MSIEIREVKTSKDLKDFIKFPFKLYKNHCYWVPPLVQFEESTLDKDKNPAFEYCSAAYFLAYKGEEIVGRIAGILHGTELQEKALVRFGWVDFINDQEVSKKLIEAVEDWAKSKNVKAIHGPMGFTDLDFEGTLIEGFDEIATQATIYNYPYYKDHFEVLGFEKACDWVEARGVVPREIPRRLKRTAEIVEGRFKFKVKEFKTNKEMLAYANSIFEILNESYAGLYGYYPLTQNQIDYYVKQYFDLVRKEYVSVVVNDKDEAIGFAICFPSFSKAFQKAKGSLFPFGFYHVLKDFYFNKTLDMFLIGVKPEYQKLGANVLIFRSMLDNFIKTGATNVMTGPMLEENFNVLNLWNDYTGEGNRLAIRRRCFIKPVRP
jgi:GNAT superfamily N-acetyltransferase